MRLHPLPKREFKILLVAARSWISWPAGRALSHGATLAEVCFIALPSVRWTDLPLPSHNLPDRQKLGQSYVGSLGDELS